MPIMPNRNLNQSAAFIEGHTLLLGTEFFLTKAGENSDFCMNFCGSAESGVAVTVPVEGSLVLTRKSALSQGNEDWSHQIRNNPWAIKRLIVQFRTLSF